MEDFLLFVFVGARAEVNSQCPSGVGNASDDLKPANVQFLMGSWQTDLLEIVSSYFCTLILMVTHRPRKSRCQLIWPKVRMHVHDCVTPRLSIFYASVNSKIQHPPGAIRGHLNFLRLTV